MPGIWYRRRMGVKPRSRDEVYRTYWQFAAERQRIFERRLAGMSGPWTEDPILATYKFCNAFRASDRVSQYFIRDVLYGDGEFGPEDTVLRTVLFRLFSRERTWKLLDEASGGLRVSTFDVKKLDRLLERELAAGRRIYTAAFILCANSAFGHARKHANHLALLEMMLQDGKLWKGLAAARALEDVYDILLGYPLIGPFMAYQIAIDLNYSEVIDFSENDFTVAGPGAKRGIRKVFSDTNGMSDSEVIMWMVENQREECEALEIECTTLFGRPLHAIDIQNLFCEVDKYSRVAYPHLKSNRSRIKVSFTPSSDPLPLFYPPKWDIHIPHGGSARSSVLVGAT